MLSPEKVNKLPTELPQEVIDAQENDALPLLKHEWSKMDKIKAGLFAVAAGLSIGNTLEGIAEVTHDVIGGHDTFAIEHVVEHVDPLSDVESVHDSVVDHRKEDPSGYERMEAPDFSDMVLHGDPLPIEPMDPGQMPQLQQVSDRPKNELVSH